MNNYRTNCNNRRVMPGSSQTMQNMQNYHVQRMETMQDNCRNRNYTDVQRTQNCERSSNDTQNCRNNCGCGDVQMSQSCECSSNEAQNSTNNCGCNDVQMSQSSECSSNNMQNDQQHHCDCNSMQNMQNCERSSNDMQPCRNNCTCSEVQGASTCRPEPTFCEFPIGMAYVPIQQWRRLYDICTAFRSGTLFQELNLDFLGRRCN